MRKLAAVVICYAMLAGCVASKVTKSGDALFKEKSYALAAQQYQQEFSSAKDNMEKARKAFLAGESYENMDNTISAEQWYKTASELKFGQDADLKYAQMLKENEKYADAVKAFQKYLTDDPGNQDAQSELQACQDAQDWKKNPEPYKITNMSSLNSPAYDYAPVLYQNGDIVFTSDRDQSNGNNTYGWTGKKFSDIYISKNLGKGNYGVPTSFSDSVNSPFNEGAACFNKDFTTCYFTRCGSNSLKNDYCHIYFSQKQDDGSWGHPVRIKFFSDTTNEQQPCLSPDGKQLYFSSDAEGGYGGKDLYVASQDGDGNWIDPTNLGASINTQGDEVFPYVNPDGDKLYFASNGLEGMGGLDIFVCSKTANGKWSSPENLKSPINSGADDFGLTQMPVPADQASAVKEMGIFTSSRAGGRGQDDIYMYQLAPPMKRIRVFVLNGTVSEKLFTDAKNPNSKVTGMQAVPDAQLDMVEVDASGNAVNSPQPVTLNAKGKYKVVVDSNEVYKLTVSKAGYFTRTATASTAQLAVTKKDTVFLTNNFTLDKIYKEVQINIPNIYYDFDKFNIRPDAAIILDTIVTVLKDNPTIKIEMGSHTDSRGSDDYNMALSQKRAQSAVDYLVSKGIDKTRLTAKGYGETMPVNGCVNGVPCTDAQYQENRRTTFKVTSE
jgi:peptidoglycan-associated lipoprotein